jgi:putative ABC transport system substrate-binding protein
VIRAAARPSACDVEIETAITALGGEPGGGLVVVLGGLPDRASIISAAARNNVPAVYNTSANVRDGGLLSYGPDNVTLGVAPPPMWIASCAARSQAISRCSFRPSSRWS